MVMRRNEFSSISIAPYKKGQYVTGTPRSFTRMSILHPGRFRNNHGILQFCESDHRAREGIPGMIPGHREVLESLSVLSMVTRDPETGGGNLFGVITGNERVSGYYFKFAMPLNSTYDEPARIPKG